MRETRTYGLTRGRAYPTRGVPLYSTPHSIHPDERLNSDLKHAITTSVQQQIRDGLLKKTKEHMSMVKSSPERVKSYFKDKHVAYAADSQ